jgi:monoamine oxidase
MADNTDTDVVIVGAGLAGLGAGTALRMRGVRHLVLEASDRIGGRAWTTCPAALGGVWFDMGAVWFHDAEHNPLAALARSAGETLLRSDEMRVERTYIGQRQANAAELADYADAWPRFEAQADRLLAEMGDVPLSRVTKHMPGDPWAATVEAWEGPVICAADADAFSTLDWRRNALVGSNLVPRGGIGAFVARNLGEGLNIRLNTAVRRVRWNGAGGRVTVETGAGAVTGKACIVTISTGVMAAGSIAFDPPLPSRVTDSVAALPMGLAVKVALRATSGERFGLPMHCSVDRQVSGSGRPLMPFQCWPFGRDYVQGWVGGSTAWDLARVGEDAVADYALGQLRDLFGSQVDKVFAGGGRLVTHWDTDPHVRGAYCYAVPGQADARLRLGEPVGDGHLMFAGEACHDGYAGTLAGAWISGQSAAGVVSDVLSPGG